ncbi:MAG: hypothetical protein MJZ68_00300 [archaeon]|nr:hypothetical protein [archaeon]
MVNRRKKPLYNDLSEIQRIIDDATFCCCPECGIECRTDHFEHKRGLVISSIDFTCKNCGKFTVDHDIEKKEWTLRGSGLCYLPNCEGNNLILYQRFDENSYATRKEALEEKYRIMESLIQPLLDSESFDMFSKVDDDIFATCKELCDMGVEKYKGILVRFIFTRSIGDGIVPVERLSEKQIEEIESLVRETDYEGMVEAVLALYSCETTGVDCGVEISQWIDLLVEKRIAESKNDDDRQKIDPYLETCNLITTLGFKKQAHELAIRTIDLIKKNITTLENADECLTEAYGSTDPARNTFEMAKEFFDHEVEFSEFEDDYCSALFGLCLHCKEHPDIESMVLDKLNCIIDMFEGNGQWQDYFFELDEVNWALAYYHRYLISGKTTDLREAFDIATDIDDEFTRSEVLEIEMKYLSVIRNNRRKVNKALSKLGMEEMDVDEVIETLVGMANGSLKPFDIF